VFFATPLVRAIDFIRDGNAIKNPIGSAERYHLALLQLEQARAAVLPLNKASLTRLVESVCAAYMPQYEPLILNCLEMFHAERMAKLHKTNSGFRQHQAASKALKELARLECHELRGAAKSRFSEVLTFWKEQEAVVRKHARV